MFTRTPAQIVELKEAYETGIFFMFILFYVYLFFITPCFIVVEAHGQIKYILGCFEHITSSESTHVLNVLGFVL